MKIGYKGFDKNLKCKGYQFKIGEIASKPEVDKPRPCTKDGFHYCNKLEDVFAYYSLNGSNRFCEIEVLGNFTDQGDKSITTSLRIIRELPIREIIDKKCEDSMPLATVKSLQQRYPLTHIGGSVGLFLHGVRLRRWATNGIADIDIVTPYFILFESFEDEKDEYEVGYIDGKKSGNDFDETFLINSLKVDCRIDPKQRYVIIEHEGFKYKVSTFETIMAAKMKYAVAGVQKHKDDIREMCGIKV
jgi:hypothetical protein